MRNSAQNIDRGSKSLQDKVNDFFQLLVGQADNSNEFSSLKGLIAELNRLCDQIFRLIGALVQGTANFIGGEPNQNGRTRGEAPHVE